MFSSSKICKGWCKVCQREHHLGPGNSYQYAEQLMSALETHKQLDFELPEKTHNPELSTDSLFGDARGKMFGVLQCQDQHGKAVILKAFSGQYNGHWLVPGWAPPLFSIKDFEQLNTPVEKVIKRLTHTILDCSDHEQVKELKKERKLRSQQLMKQLHSLYHLHNFKNQQTSLQHAFNHKTGIPTGTGDCCAPKLLNLAAKSKLTPLGITEFYWGKENRSKTKIHRTKYPSCEEKCEPILGFLLCGI